MADKYLYSGAGGAGTGADWANAYTTMVAAGAGMAVGDRLFVAHDHNESAAAAKSIVFPGTFASPNYIFCVNRAGSVPPVSADLRTTAQVFTTGAFGITFTGHFYCYGVIFSAGSGVSAAGIVTTNGTNNLRMTFELCDLILAGASGGSEIAVSLGTQTVRLLNSRLKYSQSSQRFTLRGMVEIRGGSFIAGTTSPNFVFGHSSTGTRSLIEGFDFSNLGTGFDIFSGGSTVTPTRHIVRNCKLPASWVGDVHNAVSANDARSEMWNCDSADTNYRMWIEDAAGNVKSETTLVKTGGASDGVTPLSWKFATNANAELGTVELRSPEIIVPITDTGAAKTITVDILHDSATNLKDTEVWLEVQYLGTSGVPLALIASDRVADLLAAGADQTASSATWTTTGMANPNKQKLAVTFTPQEKGVAICTVVMAKASYTLYADPLGVVS